VQTVANHLYNDAVVAIYRCTDQRVMACERHGHPLTLLLPQAGAAFDVGEEEGGGRSRFHANALLGDRCLRRLYRHEGKSWWVEGTRQYSAGCPYKTGVLC
jgi:hypothetical protein